MLSAVAGLLSNTEWKWPVPPDEWTSGTSSPSLRRLESAAALASLLLAVVCGCKPQSEAASASSAVSSTAPPQAADQHLRARMPAVAGLFYPADERALSKAIDGMLESAPVHYIPRLRALVCPHAGYEYSGQTAAIAYKTAAGRPIQTVIVMGPSHYAAFQQASLPNAEVYQTPLGKVPISEKASVLLKAAPFVLEPRCPVQRPEWWRQSPKPAPAMGEDTPETWEHSVEVQMPFLQKTLKDFKIVPAVVGDADPEQIAKALAAVVDDKTLVVASSDLSHQYPYDAASQIDRQTIKWICDLNTKDLREFTLKDRAERDPNRCRAPCGATPVLALMHLAKLKGWTPQLLDYRNSGDVTSRKDGVVGYAAIAFYEPVPDKVSAQERRFLLNLARKSLISAATNGPVPEVSAAEVSPNLAEAKGCFVTLTVNGALRGCIGTILPQEPLWRAVADNTQSAARRDPRFVPVRSDEVGRIRIEISVLTVPQPLRFNSPDDLLAKLNAYEDGVVLQIGARGATYLPQVWGQIPDKVEFLNQLSEKAGCPAAAWRGSGTSISIYHVESFEEPE